MVGQPLATSGEVVGHPRARRSGNLGWSGNLGRGVRATSGNLGHPRATSGEAVGQPRVVVQTWAVLQCGRATSGNLGRGGGAPSGEAVGQPRARWSGNLACSGEVVV